MSARRTRGTIIWIVIGVALGFAISNGHWWVIALGLLPPVLFLVVLAAISVKNDLGTVEASRSPTPRASAPRATCQPASTPSPSSPTRSSTPRS